MGSDVGKHSGDQGNRRSSKIRPLAKGQMKLYWKPWGYSKIGAKNRGLLIRECA